ncbi:MAG TPA: hypothetical protein PK156_43950 [Polyangium sp.]|nr:hypothetical protein [Polyangium sp.]
MPTKQRLTPAPFFRDPASVNRFALLGLALVLPTLVACSSGQSKAPPPKSASSPSWTGTWTQLEGLAIPPEKRFNVLQKCNQTAEYWTIEQKDSLVTLELHPAAYETGVKMAVERVRIEKARGSIHKSFARLEGQFGTEVRGNVVDEEKSQRGSKFPVTYELQWEPRTEHLSGTRNGSPVRFVRTEFQPIDFTQCPRIP